MIKTDANNDGYIQEKEDGTVVIATKTSRAFAERLSKLSKSRGYKVYGMLRNCADTIVRYMDDRHNLSPEIEKAMSMFEHLQGWKDNFNLADPNTNPQVVRAVYFLGDEHKKGERAVMVETPFFGHWAETYNVQIILEATIEKLYPEMYRQLRDLGNDLETHSVSETLQQIIVENVNEQQLACIRKGFEENNRSEFGVAPHEGAPYRRKMHKDVDSQSGLQPIDFDDEDKTLSRLESEDWQPHGAEL